MQALCTLLPGSDLDSINATLKANLSNWEQMKAEKEIAKLDAEAAKVPPIPYDTGSSKYGKLLLRLQKSQSLLIRHRKK